MTEFLLFTLYAPLASWGDIAVGESRGSWDRPSRSAILGLLGAALGVERADQAAHGALVSGYGVAVRQDAAGTVLSDYHTVQTVAANVVRRERPATRAQLLGRPSHELETILSRRTYRQDALATVALWTRDDPRWSLAELAAALLRPAFTLYAGRKANPLGAPVHPEIVEAASLAAALRGRRPGIAGVSDHLLRGRDGWGREVAHDAVLGGEGAGSGLRMLRREVRRDIPVHRARWHFAERVVEVGLLEEEPRE